MGFRHAIFSKVISAFIALAVLITAGATVSSCGSSRHASSGSHKSASAAVSSSKSKSPGTITIDKSLPSETRALLAEASKWLGTGYRYGGDTRSGVDCSGLVLNLYRSALAIKLPRSSSQQREYCTRISKKDLMEGDLVFFTTGSNSKVNHVGMYVGNGRMIHSSTSRGVIVSALDEAYYTRTFHSAGRVDSYYAMVRGKKSGKRKTAEPVALPSPADDVMLAQTTQSSSQTSAGQTSTSTTQTSAKVTDRIVEEIVRPAVTNTVRIAANEAAVRISEKTGISVAAVTPPAATRKAMEVTKRRILDETLNQKVDSIVSEYFD
ncbi:MAG: C40 family peptidase [Paramuribaculum sp.]|nr:C40 family peptidase [Paramuribaculum sp.]